MRVIPRFAVVISLAVALFTAAATAAVRSNLCTLRVTRQVHALGMHGRCTPHPASKVGAMTIAAADWGTAADGVGITVYSGISKSQFRAEFGGGGGSAVRLGSFARDRSVPAGVELNAWVRGVGLYVDLRHAGTARRNRVYRARLIALGRAVAKQL